MRFILRVCLVALSSIVWASMPAPCQQPATKPPRVSPAYPDAAKMAQPMALCPNPMFPSNRDWDSHATDTPKMSSSAAPVFSWRFSKPDITLLGPFDMTVADCVPKTYDLYVKNEQELSVLVDHDAYAVCSANITYTDNPPIDYPAILFGAVATNWIHIGKAATQKITLPAKGVKNTAATVTLSCSAPDDDQHKNIDLGVQRKVIVHYGGVDLLTASTGVIISTLGKKIYGIKTIETGTTPGASVTTQSSIEVTSSSNMQFVPMGVVNLNFAGNRSVNFNVQGGLGINPNGSSTQVEYFVGPSIGFHNFYLSPGLHIARAERLSNGFQLGDVVSSASFSVPTEWYATYKFGITLSYKPYK